MPYPELQTRERREAGEGWGRAAVTTTAPGPASCQSAHTSCCLLSRGLMGTVWATICSYCVHWLRTGAPQRRWLQPSSPKDHRSAPGQTRVSSSCRFTTTQHLPAKEGVPQCRRVKCLIKACVQAGADVGAADEPRKEKWGT